MATLNEIKNNTLGQIAALQTLLERYPVLETINSLKESSLSFDFMIDILRIIGVDRDDLLEWAANLITGDGDGGMLDTFENVIKSVLKTNISSLFSCTINPIISDDLLDYHKVKDKNGDDMPNGIYTEGNGIEIDLDEMDFIGTLRMSPTSDIGKYYYFDNDRKPNELYKSRDFNAFLWYVINKGLMTEEGNEKYKMIWDNRNKIKIKNTDINSQNNFYEALTPAEVDVYNQNYIPQKKQIIQCQFVEKSFPFNNKLKVQLCSNTYYKTRQILDGNDDNSTISVNKTIFEFNNDYIDSLKLFDSKVLMSQIIDKLTGTIATQVNYSINELVVKGQIGEIVKKIIESDDTNISDCYFSFSNEKYDSLIQEYTLKHGGIYKYTDVNYNGITFNDKELLNSLNEMNEDATLQEKNTIIKNTFTQVAATIAKDGYGEVSDNFSFETNLIYQMINEISYAIISSILTPKVMILLRINNYIMGNELPDSLNDILKNLSNLIVAIIKEIKNLILNELYNFLIKQLMPLIELFSDKLLLESIQYYKELLNNLLGLIDKFKGEQPQSVIDNVNYADIIPEETVPSTNIC